MHEDVLNRVTGILVVMFGDCGRERRDLHEIWPCADDRKKFHGKNAVMRPRTAIEAAKRKEWWDQRIAPGMLNISLANVVSTEVM